MEVVDTRYGKLIASRNDVYIGRGLFDYGEFSEGEVEFFRQIIQKDWVVCDVGANIGAHTLAFSYLAKHVYAFEPMPRLFQALAGMCALNDLNNVTTVPAGCSSRDGLMSYESLDFDRLNNFGATSLKTYCGERGTRVVPLTVECQFLKIDVEGMELDVLRGAEKMIKKCQPVMYIEMDREDKFEPLVDFIVKHLGYHPYWHLPMLYNPENFLKNPENHWEGVCSINAACFPFEVPELTPIVGWPNFSHHNWPEHVR